MGGTLQSQKKPELVKRSHSLRSIAVGLGQDEQIEAADGAGINVKLRADEGGTYEVENQKGPV